MKNLTTYLLILLATLVAADKYAIVFGTADGWDNYSITSVFLLHMI